MGARHRVGMASIIVSVLLLGGCKPSSDATQAPEAPTSTVNAEHELVDDMQGVWATTNGSGTDGNETVFMLAVAYDDVMQITRDGAALDLLADDIDPAQDTATFRIRSGDDEGKRITFAKVMVPGAEQGAFTLRVTYPDGRNQDLSFVRRLGKQDIAEMERAFDGPGMLPDAPPQASANGVDCQAMEGFRARTVCKDQTLHDLDLRLAEQFDYLACWSIDVESTRKAAYKQLDACSDSQCLSKSYADWIRYMDENYDIGDVTCDGSGHDYE